MDPSLSDVHAEVFARHGTSVQPESLQLKAILQAVTEVIQAEGMEVTPLTLFAATMSALEKPETVASAEVGAAGCRNPPVIAASPAPSMNAEAAEADACSRCLSTGVPGDVLPAGHRSVQGAQLHRALKIQRQRCCGHSCAGQAPRTGETPIHALRPPPAYATLHAVSYPSVTTEPAMPSGCLASWPSLPSHLNAHP